MPHNDPDHDHQGGGYGGLVGRRLNGTLLKLVHAMDEKLPVTDECLSLMLQSAEAYFERCANNDVTQLSAEIRHKVYRVGVVSTTVNGEEDLVRQETFTTTGRTSTKACSLEIRRLIAFAHNCNSPLIMEHKKQVWDIFSFVEATELDEKRSEAVQRILVRHCHLTKATLIEFPC